MAQPCREILKPGKGQAGCHLRSSSWGWMSPQGQSLGWMSPQEQQLGFNVTSSSSWGLMSPQEQPLGFNVASGTESGVRVVPVCSVLHGVAGVKPSQVVSSCGQWQSHTGAVGSRSPSGTGCVHGAVPVTDELSLLLGCSISRQSSCAH